MTIKWSWSPKHIYGYHNSMAAKMGTSGRGWALRCFPEYSSCMSRTFHIFSGIQRPYGLYDPYAGRSTAQMWIAHSISTKNQGIHHLCSFFEMFIFGWVDIPQTVLALKGFLRCWERGCYGVFGDPSAHAAAPFLLLFHILRACDLRHSAAKWSLFSNML